MSTEIRQMSQQEAIAFHDSKAYEAMSDRERAEFQMVQDRLCMPFGVFHGAVEKTLGRPVFTHEFGLNREGLMKELLGERAAPSFGEILALLPADKRIIIAAAGAA